jgi:holo-[acyl-carrier protein] synthase
VPPPQPAEIDIRVGVDAVSVNRLERVIGADAGRRATVFTERELDHCSRRRRREFDHLAARFAAKEAVLKVLGTGITRGVRLTDVEVVNDRKGRPRIVLGGAAAELARERGLRQIDVSLTHTDGLAIATAVTLWGFATCAST